MEFEGFGGDGNGEEELTFFFEKLWVSGSLVVALG